MKVVPASSRSSRISAGIAASGIQRAGIERNITGNVPVTPGIHQERGSVLEEEEEEEEGRMVVHLQGMLLDNGKRGQIPA